MCRLNVNCVVEKMEKFGVYVAILKLIGFSDYIFHKIEMKFRKFFCFCEGICNRSIKYLALSPLWCKYEIRQIRRRRPSFFPSQISFFSLVILRIRPFLYGWPLLFFSFKSPTFISLLDYYRLFSRCPRKMLLISQLSVGHCVSLKQKTTYDPAA